MLSKYSLNDLNDSFAVVLKNSFLLFKQLKHLVEPIMQVFIKQGLFVQQALSSTPLQPFN